ncbi:GvpL/GvpF family gas vesicle protein [Kitasatospora sp. NPDC004745]|uniref:GvpL/GvpF family gas vesicle protein n=1 Tax=Kitasatospora sp. NPDC004745 TaxID=3364019 RepID=UPI00367D3EF8
MRIPESWQARLERTARAHHRVIETLARTGPTLPLRFATIYRDDRCSEAMLHARRTELEAGLRRVAHRTERGVKAYLTRGPAVTPPEADRPRPAGGDQRPGTAYLLRRRAQHEGRQRAATRALDEARQIHAALAATAAESALHPLQSPETTGRGEPMVLNGAYLVDDARLRDLDRELVTLALHHPGLRLEVTGPWPPYSFSGVEPAGGERS